MPSATPTPELERIRRGLEESSRVASALAGPASVDTLTRRPRDGAWSAAECLAHLTLSARAYLPALDRAIQEARSRGTEGTGPFHMDPIGWLIRTALDPAMPIPTRTPPRFVPVETGAPERVLDEFLTSQAELIERVRASEGLALDRIRIQSPVDARVRYNLLSAFEILETHERRHLRQAQRAVAEAGGKR